MRAVIGGVLAAGLLVSPAFAQSSSGPWNGLSDRFQIDTGYFRITANTVLRYNGAQGSGDIDFEQDLGVDEKVDTFWVDATWRVGRRHQLKLAYTKLNRDRADYTLGRDFTWGGQTYNAGLSASTSTGSDILGGYYRFALFRNDRFEIGPSLGIGYLWLNAGIRATGSITGPGGTESRTLDESASTGSITGALGGYANGWPAKRLVTRATSSTSRRIRAHRGVGHRLAARGGLLLLPQRRSRRPVQVQQVHLRPRDPGQRPGRRGHVQGLPDLPVVPVLVGATGQRPPRSAKSA